jgi:hypothetical protein
MVNEKNIKNVNRKTPNKGPLLQWDDNKKLILYTYDVRILDG